MTGRTDTPQDRFCLVGIFFFILGLGTLLPWNFFMTASLYFQSRLNTETNGTVVRKEYHFNNWMTFLSQLPLLVFTLLNSFMYQRISEAIRISGSLVFILLLFILTAVLMKGHGCRYLGDLRRSRSYEELPPYMSECKETTDSDCFLRVALDSALVPVETKCMKFVLSWENPVDHMVGLLLQTAHYSRSLPLSSTSSLQTGTSSLQTGTSSLQTGTSSPSISTNS